MHRTIELTPQFQAVAPPSPGGFRFRVDVTATQNVEPEIFLYLTAPTIPGTAGVACKFQKICTPADVAAYPSLSQAAAATSLDAPWVRAPYVDLVFVTRAEADDAWTIIQQDVASLLEAYSLQDEMDTLAPITIAAGS